MEAFNADFETSVADYNRLKESTQDKLFYLIYGTDNCYNYEPNQVTGQYQFQGADCRYFLPSFCSSMSNGTCAQLSNQTL